MKGFIEVTRVYTQGNGYRKSEHPSLINIKDIEYIDTDTNGYTLLQWHDDINYIRVIDSYEKVKQLIEEAQK